MSADHLIREILRSKDATGVIVSHLPHIRWICGFTGSTGLLIARENKFNFLTNSIYESQAALGDPWSGGSHRLASYG